MTTPTLSSINTLPVTVQPELLQTTSEASNPKSESSPFAEAFKHIKESEPQNKGYSYDQLLFIRKKLTLQSSEFAGDTMISLCSSFRALDLFSIRAEKAQGNNQSLKYLIMIDNNERIKEFWVKLQKLMSPNISREDAMRAIFLDFMTNLDQWKTDQTEMGQVTCNIIKLTPEKTCKIQGNKLTKAIDAGLSWLSTAERFKKTLELFVEKRFAFIPADFLNETSLKEIVSIVKEKGRTIDSVFLYQMREIAEAKGMLTQFHQSIEALRPAMTDKTLILDTAFRLGGASSKEPLKLRIITNMVSSNIETIFTAPHNLPKTLRDRIKKEYQHEKEKQMKNEKKNN